MRRQNVLLFLLYLTLALIFLYYIILRYQLSYSLNTSMLQKSFKVHIQYFKSKKNLKGSSTSKTKNKQIHDKLSKKRILFWGTFYGSSTLESYCINELENNMKFCDFSCEYSTDQSNSSLEASEAILIHGREENVTFPTFRFPHQRWVYLMFESPAHTYIYKNFEQWDNVFNWTMSYRRDSDVFTPYGQLLPKKKIGIVPVDSEEYKESLLPFKQHLGYKRLGAWAVSNCVMVTSKRKSVIDELSQYIGIDIYGSCGLYQCPGKALEQCNSPEKCFEYLGPLYKFYFAFENSICEDYITEKIFNALKFGMVPVVLGPDKEDYLKHVPEGSFIHVDDFENIEELANYLKYLDENDDEYLNYFKWKLELELDPVYYFQRAWCNLCTKLNTECNDATKSQKSVYAWWFDRDGKRVCKS